MLYMFPESKNTECSICSQSPARKVTRKRKPVCTECGLCAGTVYLLAYWMFIVILT